ncbi:MAG: hypothetical protein HYY53_03195 [candidate division NC10 bacterium]|nr:hypothetical protein [candidate division NC10 bacterium]
MPRLGRLRAGAPLFLVLLLLCAGVGTAQQAGTGEPAPGSFEEMLANLPVEALHQVQREDNLHLIAAYYYGDARQWPRVYTANRGLIGKNPSVIHKGHVLKIHLPAGWAPLEPYDRFLARVRATGIPGLTAPPEAGGGKAAAEAPPPVEAAPAAPPPAPPAAPAEAPAAPKSY